MVSIYFLFVRIAALFSSKAQRLVQGEKKAYQELAAKIDPQAHYIWFHAASVGEFEQGRPLIEKMKQENPNIKILLTFFSPSGYEMRKNYPLADIVTYLPFATRRKSRHFVDLVKPEKAIFIKYEFWPNYLKALYKKKIPTYIIAAIFNKKQAFFQWYGIGYRKCLKYFTHLYVQDENSAKLLARYNITNTTVAGDPRFDRVVTIASTAKSIPLIEQFAQGQPVLVAGSTWGPDEDLLIRYYREKGNFKLILVPHEIHQAHLHTIFQKLKGQYIRYTEATMENVTTANCMVVDTMGLLSSIYQYATIAYIGGGFGVGIHNTLEAAVYGIPVVFGPNYQRFREAKELIACQGAFSVKNYAQAVKIIDKLFLSSAVYGDNSKKYINSNVGLVNLIKL